MDKKRRHEIIRRREKKIRIRYGLRLESQAELVGEITAACDSTY